LGNRPVVALLVIVRKLYAILRYCANFRKNQYN